MRLSLPHFEMTWLKAPEFFPNRDTALAQKTQICIGTKSRNLGDALILTPLVRALKSKYPDLKLYSFPRAFNPVVFHENPAIERVSYFPDRVFGDDCNWGSGHVIEQKIRFFDLPDLEFPRPEIYLSVREKEWASQWLKENVWFQTLSKRKPVCLIHRSGMTWKNLLPMSYWESGVRQWKEKYSFVQLGMVGDASIPGTIPFFMDKKFWNARKLFALMNSAQALIGIDSGPMHVARAFQIPSLIWICGVDSKKVFESRSQYPYFLAKNWRFANLYEENQHVRADGISLKEFETKFSDFLIRG